MSASACRSGCRQPKPDPGQPGGQPSGRLVSERWARWLMMGMAWLNISLQLRHGWPWQSGWKLVGPSSKAA